jgi:hypothetical protein
MSNFSGKFYCVLYTSNMNIRKDARFEVFMAVMIQVEVFWVVMLCCVPVQYQYLTGLCCLYLQGEVKMEALRSSKM